MDACINLSTQLAFLTQQLQRRKLAYGQHQRVASQGWNPYRPMEQVQYVDNPYLNTYNPGLQLPPNLPLNTNSKAPQPPQEKKTNLEEAMVELAKFPFELAKSHTE